MESPIVRFLRGNKLSISWDHPCDFVQNYEIYRSVKDHPESRTLIETLPGSVNQYFDTSFEANVEYTYQIVPLFSGDVPDVSCSFDYHIPSLYEGMVLIPDGNILNNPDKNDDWLGENPISKEVDAFYISINEVRNSEYFQFLKETGHLQPPNPHFVDMMDYYYEYPDYPIVMVDWYDAAEYCNWLSKRLGLIPVYDSIFNIVPEANGYHLPEKDQYIMIFQLMYGSDMKLDKQKITQNLFGSDDAYPYTAPVGIFNDSTAQFRINDLLGNVSEWTEDVFTSGNNVNDESLKMAKVMGGSWKTSKGDLDPSFSLEMDITSKYNHVGFRVVLDANPTE
jgi:hypothetical protein